jgi:hypothetical protein
MNKLEYLFFNVYNWYYKMSLYRPKVNPKVQTVFVFALCIGGWCIILFLLLVGVILHRPYNQRNVMLVGASIIFLFYFIFDRVFIDSYKYLDIYNKYKEYAKTNVKGKRDTAISFLIIFMPYLLGMLYILLSIIGIVPL